jgi:hypothetical protein
MRKIIRKWMFDQKLAFARLVAREVRHGLIYDMLAATGVDKLERIIALNKERGGNPDYTSLALAYNQMLKEQFPVRAKEDGIIKKK